MLLKTSRHRPAMTVIGFEYLMRTHGTCGFRLLGTTGSDEDFGWNVRLNQGVRGKQIRAWLKEHAKRHGVERYVAIDDDDLGITRAGIPLVQTHAKWGLGERTSREAIRLLNGTK